MTYPYEKLRGHIEVLSGFAFKSADFCDHGIPVIKIKNITPPFVSLEDLSYVSTELANEQEKYQLKYGDVLIALTGSHINQMASVVGRVARVKYNTPSLLNQRVGKIIVCSADTDLDYVYYYLSQDDVKIKLASKAGGAANQANISPSDIKDLIVPFPKLETQRRIADILSAYDDLIENNQKQISLLEEAAQRLYKEWFVDLRFPGCEHTRIIDGVPEGWEKATINSIAEYINGYAFKPSDWGKAGLPIIKIKEMTDGVTSDTPRNIGDNIPKKYIIKSGDIIFSWSATLSAMIWDGEDGLLNQHLFKVIPCKNITSEFVLQSLRFNLAEFNNLTTGSTMKHIQRGKLDKVFVNLPPENVMKNYNEISEPLRKQVLNLKRQEILLKQARDRLPPKLMNGEMEV